MEQKKRVMERKWVGTEPKRSEKKNIYWCSESKKSVGMRYRSNVENPFCAVWKLQKLQPMPADQYVPTDEF